MRWWHNERAARTIHRWIGAASLAFLLVSVSTGLLWANARFLYWPDHYKEKVRTVEAPPLASVRVPLHEVFEQSRKAFGGAVTVDRIMLRSDFGRLVYEVGMRVDGKARALLLDAQTGEALSPISESLAKTIAQQYVQEDAMITDVNVEPYMPRNKRLAHDAVRVRFNDPHRTEIILDRQTGEILEDEGRWRKFHFLVMQVHQLNFFGFHKTLLNVIGIPLLVLGFSGLILWGMHLARRRRQTKKATTPYPSSHW